MDKIAILEFNADVYRAKLMEIRERHVMMLSLMQIFLACQHDDIEKLEMNIRDIDELVKYGESIRHD